MSRTDKQHATSRVGDLQTNASIIPPSADELRDLIARRAYELYEQRGAGYGDELSDWLSAEQEAIGVLLTQPSDVAIEQIPLRPLADEGNGKRRIKAVRGAGASTKMHGSSRRKSKPKGSPAQV